MCTFSEELQSYLIKIGLSHIKELIAISVEIAGKPYHRVKKVSSN